MNTAAKTSELRKTGINIIGDLPWGTHFCYFYETKRDLLETLVLYFKEGLESKEFCVWIVSPALSLEEAKHALRQTVPELERHIEEGHLEIHSHDEWYLRNGRWDSQRVLQSWRERLSQISADGYAGLRAAGDGGWVRRDDWMAFREYEEEVNALIADQQSIILCTYPISTSPGDQVFDVAHIHGVAVARRHGNWEVVETPELREAKAKIERLNEELERKVEERTRELAAANEALKAEIAERKLAEQAVKRAEDRIRRVIDTTPALIHTGRPDGYLDYFNQRWLEYVGISLDKIKGWAWTNVIHPEDVEGMVNEWRAVIASGEPFRYEARVRRADGEYRWMLHHKVPLRDEQGNIVKWYGSSIDIEDRKRAEMETRVLIDAIPHQIWSGPVDGTLDYCNERWRSYMGLEQADLCGAGWQSMLHPGDRDRVLAAWHEAVVKGTPYEQEERHRGADGTYRWFLSLGVPLRDADGRIVRWYGTNTDIEDRKRAEEALNAQALRYKTLMETSTDSIYVLDEKGDLQEANAAFLHRRGYTAAEVKGLNVADWDARLSREQLQARIRKLAGRSAVFETRHRCKDGSVFEVEVSATSVRIAGEQLFFCVTRDITERKQAEDRLRRSEEKFKTLFGIAPVGISVLDQRLDVIDANPALERILRLTREELLGGTWRRRTYLDPTGTRKPREEMTSVRAVAEKRSFDDVETGIVTESGEIIWTQVSAAPLDLPNGSVVVITQDITERKRAAKELEEANQQLRTLSRQLFHLQEEERRHLARELHDEIGQNLTAAKINLNIIARDVPAHATGRLDDSIQLLDALLLQVRQISLGLRPPLLDELGLVPTLRWLVDQQAQRAGLRMTFTATVDDLELDPAIQTSCFRVAQEAITNIIRHSGAKNVAVELRHDAERLWLSVRDDGAGFDPAAIQHSATQHSTLGLVSMKERALLVHGGLEVHTAPGQGAEIRAWFPLVLPEQDSSPQTP
ncbi:MAG: hypothetical protein QOH88_412 [Verrucomicrobiota bacterium]|jgi:PAS domain S-box-containing protein